VAVERTERIKSIDSIDNGDFLASPAENRHGHENVGDARGWGFHLIGGVKESIRMMGRLRSADRAVRLGRKW
jgi:hypothetical protein